MTSSCHQSASYVGKQPASLTFWFPLFHSQAQNVFTVIQQISMEDRESKVLPSEQWLSSRTETPSPRMLAIDPSRSTNVHAHVLPSPWRPANAHSPPPRSRPFLTGLDNGGGAPRGVQKKSPPASGFQQRAKRGDPGLIGVGWRSCVPCTMLCSLGLASLARAMLP